MEVWNEGDIPLVQMEVWNKGIFFWNKWKFGMKG
jgi:hypothetical protein